MNLRQECTGHCGAHLSCKWLLPPGLPANEAADVFVGRSALMLGLLCLEPQVFAWPSSGLDVADLAMQEIQDELVHYLGLILVHLMVGGGHCKALCVLHTHMRSSDMSCGMPVMSSSIPAPAQSMLACDGSHAKLLAHCALHFLVCDVT